MSAYLISPFPGPLGHLLSSSHRGMDIGKLCWPLEIRIVFSSDSGTTAVVLVCTMYLSLVVGLRRSKRRRANDDSSMHCYPPVFSGRLGHDHEESNYYFVLRFILDNEAQSQLIETKVGRGGLMIKTTLLIVARKNTFIIINNTTNTASNTVS